MRTATLTRASCPCERLQHGRTVRVTVILFLFFTSCAAIAQTVNDPNLKVQRWVKGLDQPTGVAFVDNGATALVLEKSTGRVRIVQNRTITGTAIDLPVANDSERGLLGIALD